MCGWYAITINGQVLWINQGPGTSVLLWWPTYTAFAML